MFANRTLNAILWLGYFEMNFPMEFIDEKKIDFKSANQSGLTSSFLLSVRKSQDSLMFNTALTTLDLTDYGYYLYI